MQAFLLCVLGVLGGGRAALAQFEMPDMKQMSGIPRPVTDLPDHTISVRLIRGDLSHNITNFPVELRVGSKVRTAQTDDAGRAQFSEVPPGAVVKAVAVVDGERLESQEFPAPERGGIRLMLVATDTSRKPAPPPETAVPGQVSIGGQSRIVMEPADEAVEVYYLLEIVNNANGPVNPTTPFEIELPTGAVGAGLLEGSSPKASVAGPHVRVQGPLPPGRTLLQVGFELPAPTGSIDIAQRLPATLDRLAVIVKKLEGMRLVSPQIATEQDMTAQGETFIAASGGAVAASQPVVLRLEDLPHHSPAPRWIALALAAVIVGFAVWAVSGPEDQAVRVAERRRLVARRDRLFTDLVRLEADHCSGRGDRARYLARREELVSALEHVYGALDSEDALNAA